MAQPPKNTEAMNEQKRTSYSRNPTTDAGAGAGACSSYAVIDDSCGTHSYGWFSDIEAEPEILYLEYKHDIESGVYKVRSMHVHVPVKRPKIEISLTGEILSGDTDSELRKDAGAKNEQRRTSYSRNEPTGSCSELNTNTPTLGHNSEVFAHAIPYDIWRIQPLSNDDDACDIGGTDILPSFYISASPPRRTNSWVQCAQSCMRQYSTCIHFTLYAITACVWYVMLTA
jgi:hypothetical protein